MATTDSKAPLAKRTNKPPEVGPSSLDKPLETSLKFKSNRGTMIDKTSHDQTPTNTDNQGTYEVAPITSAENQDDCQFDNFNMVTYEDQSLPRRKSSAPGEKKVPLIANQRVHPVVGARPKGSGDQKNLRAGKKCL